MKKLLATILFSTFVLIAFARDNKQWMKDIDDSYPLTMMSIPGTHDTGTGHGFPEAYESLGEMTARTQQLLLAEQWNKGIRAFDLRPRAVDGVLKIYHGMTETKLHMAGALLVLKLMIHEYPTEGAIIMQNEGDSSGWDLLMKELLKAYVDNGLLIDYRPDLTMGDLRGHVVVLSRSEYDEEGKPYGGYIEGWPGTLVSTPNPIEGNIKYNGGSSKVVIQDYYQNVVPATKNNSIGNLLQASDDSRKKGTVSNTLYINHCSGYVSPNPIYDIVKAILQNAEATNAYASDIIESQTNMVTGLVMIDFAGVDTHVYNGTEYNVQGARLVDAVINSNDYNYTKITEVVGDDNAVNSKSVYNLSGQRLNRLQKGFNIVGGKKVIIQ